MIEQSPTEVRPAEICYSRTQVRAEIDLLILHRARRVGVEVKYGDAPKLTPSMTTACNDLKLDRLTVVYPGTRQYDLVPRIVVQPLQDAIRALQ